MLLLVIVWGINFPIMKSAFAEIPPFVFNGLRFIVASVLLAAVLRVREGPLRVARADLPGLILLGLVGHAGYQSLYIAGLARTSAGHTSVILSMVPLFVGLLGAALRIEHPTARMWIGLALAFAGIIVLVGSGAGLSLDSAMIAGDVIVLAAAVCWATYTVMSRPWLSRFSALRLTTVTLFFGLPVILASAVPGLAGIAWAAVSLRAWAALAFSAVFAIVVSYVIWYASVQAVGSTRTAALSNLIPVVALLSSWAMLREPLGPPQVLGASVVLLGVWLARHARVAG
jgi:drug/metabolite transporter (DMT)-like permease